jgi:hypothetical protein
MYRHRFAAVGCAFALLSVAPVGAMPVSGKVELPDPPKRPEPAVRGFTERVDNPKKPIKPFDVGPYLVVVLENDNTKPDNPGQVKWELVGDSFSPPVKAVPVGAQVVIKNTSNTARTLAVAEDPKLIQTGLINPKIGERTFTVTEPKAYTLGDKDAPHLTGKLVVVATSHISYVEVTEKDGKLTGKFEFADVPEGSYKLRIFFQDHWLEQTETVTVPGKGKTHEHPAFKLAAYAEKKK